MAAQNKNVRIDATGFYKYLRELEQKLRPPVRISKIMQSETLSVLKKAAEKTKRTTKAKAGGKYNPASKFYKGWVTLNGRKYYCGPSRNGLKGFRYSDALWNRLMARMAQNRKRAETRVGLSLAVFYRVAADLKLPRYSSGWDDSQVIRTSYLRSGGMGSAAKSGPVWGTRKVAQTKRDLRGKNPKLEFSITSTNTFNPFTKGRGALQASLNGRRKYFERNVKEGVFDTTKDIARAYPGIYHKR